MIYSQSLQMESFALVGSLWLCYAGGIYIYSNTGMQHEAEHSSLCLEKAVFASRQQITGLSALGRVLWALICLMEVSGSFDIGGSSSRPPFIRPCIIWGSSEEVRKASDLISRFATYTIWNMKARELSSRQWFCVPELGKSMVSASLEIWTVL